jgi:poly-beta-hydroxyalkanoate depolymerase
MDAFGKAIRYRAARLQLRQQMTPLGDIEIAQTMQAYPSLHSRIQRRMRCTRWHLQQCRDGEGAGTSAKSSVNKFKSVILQVPVC